MLGASWGFAGAQLQPVSTTLCLGTGQRCQTADYTALFPTDHLPKRIKGDTSLNQTSIGSISKPWRPPLLFTDLFQNRWVDSRPNFFGQIFSCRRIGNAGSPPAGHRTADSGSIHGRKTKTYRESIPQST